MTAFSIERVRLGSQELIHLCDAKRGRTVRIARLGAALVSLEQKLENRVHALTDGYRDAAEIESRPSSRFAIMAPFANRIADARYVFDGQSYDLQPGVSGAQRASRHGFVRGVTFDVAAEHADDDTAYVQLTTSVIRPDAFPGYPFAIDLTVRFTLDARGLTLIATMRNVGDHAAPCFFGWHPYFRVGDGEVDSWELQIPAKSLVRTDADLIPLAGDAAYQPLDEAPRELDFRTSKPIGPTKIDCGYAHLQPDADGLIRTRLRNPASGLGLTVWQEDGIMLAFSADTVTRDVRRAIALEPMESMSNAFNRSDCAAAIRLEPGAERHFRCGVEIELV